VKKAFVFALLGLILSLILAACGGQGAAASTTLNVEMSEFMFKPKDLAAPVGQEITLNLKNEGAIEHDFVILKKGATAATPFKVEAQKEDLLFEARLMAGQAGAYTFTLPEAGDYEVICSVPGHLEAGMKAKLSAR